MIDYGLVSVIMPSYNTADFIAGAIQSVINQTYGNWEMIIVDDCSTDDTDMVVSEFNDVRVKYLKNDKNQGAALSRNRALREAKGKWIAFLDSDDQWLPVKLERQLRFMIENGYKFSCTDYRVISAEDGQPLYVVTGPKVVNKRKLYNYCYMTTSTVIYDQNSIGLIQIADIKKNNDYAMWFHIIRKSNCYRLLDVLTEYHKRENSISGGSKFKLIKHHYIMYRNALGKDKLLSVVCTLNNILFGVMKKIIYHRKISRHLSI